MGVEGFTIVAVLGALFLGVLIILVMAIRIVPEYERMVVFRLGRVMGSFGQFLTNHRSSFFGRPVGREGKLIVQLPPTLVPTG